MLKLYFFNLFTLKERKSTISVILLYLSVFLYISPISINGLPHSKLSTSGDAKFQTSSVDQAISFSAPLDTHEESYIVLKNGSIACWPSDECDSPVGSDFVQVSTGGNLKSCALRNNGSIICWGSGGTDPPSGTFLQVSVSTYTHSCALRDNGQIVCWGGNNYGECDVISGTYTQVTAGYLHTCGLKVDGTAVCWGRNINLEINVIPASYVQVIAGNWITCGLTVGGTINCWGTKSFGDPPPSGSDFVQISLSRRRGLYCALRDNGSIICWGGDDFYYSFIFPDISYIQVSAGYTHACGLREDGYIDCPIGFDSSLSSGHRNVSADIFYPLGECVTGCDICTSFTGYSRCYSCSPGYRFNSVFDTCVACSCTPCSDYCGGGVSDIPQFFTKATGCSDCSVISDYCNNCDPGYGFDSGECTACYAGLYSEGGTASCQTNTAENCFVKSTEANECSSCIEGYGLSSGDCSIPCVACNSWSDNGTVSSCYTFTKNTSCSDCSVTSDYCNSCDAGYGFDFVNGTCNQCIACLSYSSGGNSECLEFTKSTGCSICDTSSDECITCEAAYGYADHSCSACSACTNFSSGATSTCETFTKAAGCSICSLSSDECIESLPGYEMINGTCSACPVGQFSEGGTDPCDENEAINCFVKSTEANKCLSCIEGYEFSSGDCTIPCIACNSWSDNGTVTDCYTFTNATGCSDCSVISDYCNRCDAGYGFSSGVCTACLTGDYSEGETAECELNTASNCFVDSTEANKCVSCVEGYAFSSGYCSIPCFSCISWSANNTVSACSPFSKVTGCSVCSTSADFCDSCYAGYGFASGVCSICSAGNFSDGGTDACLINTAENCFTRTTESNECTSCVEGYAFSHDVCTPCADGYYSFDGNIGLCTENPAENCYKESSVAELCISCLAGYGFSEGNCSVCSIDNFSINENTEACLENTADHCFVKSQVANSCLSCLAGHVFESGTCISCPEGSYSFDGNTGSCTENTAASCYVKSKISNDCSSCLAGYGFSNGNCTACTACEYWSYDGTITACSPFTQLNCSSCSVVADDCTSCLVGDGLRSGVCVDCETVFGYSVGGTSDCLPCDPACSTCSPFYGGCLTCKNEGEWLFGSPGLIDTTCVVTCDGQVKDKASGNNSMCITACPSKYEAGPDEVCSFTESISMIWYVSIGVLAISILFLFAVFVFGRLRNMHSQEPVAALATFVTIYDFVTDVMLLYSIRGNSKVTLLFYIGSGHLILSILINSLILFRVLAKTSKNNLIFRSWLMNRLYGFGFIAALACTNLNITAIWTSHLFGLEIFSAPFGNDLMQFKGLGLVSQLLEDVPQLVIQLMVASNLYGLSFDALGEWDAILLSSIIATLLSVIIGIFSKGILLVTMCTAGKNSNVSVGEVKTFGGLNTPGNDKGTDGPDTPSIQLELPINVSHFGLIEENTPSASAWFSESSSTEMTQFGGEGSTIEASPYITQHANISANMGKSESGPVPTLGSR